MLDKKMYGEVPEVVHNRVLDTLDSLDKVRSFSVKRKVRLPRAAAVCLACFLISGVTVSAMGIVSLYRQRMEEMNAQMLEEYYRIADAGETTEFSRPLTDGEKERYEELNEEYENSGHFPESQFTCLKEAGEYEGKGVGLDISSRTLYLPEQTLSDEELLQIIDFEHKVTYSIYEQSTERIANSSGWQSRMAEMDDQEVDEIYRTLYCGNSEISGAYSRALSGAELERYKKLAESYENEGLYALSELTVVQAPEEYAGTGVAVCTENSTYYLPDSELTDEELLQIIDLEHKGTYCLDRINQEIDLGLREGYPQR